MYFGHVCSMSKQIGDWESDLDSDTEWDWYWDWQGIRVTARMGIEFIASIYLCVCQCQMVAPPRPAASHTVRMSDICFGWLSVSA